MIDLSSTCKGLVTMNFKFEEQFTLPRKYYVDNLDFINWYRFFYLVKDTLGLGCQSVLEVGSGSGFVKSCLTPHVKNYWVLDINEKLKPDFVQDVRVYNKKLKDIDPIIEEAIGRILENPSNTPSSNQSVALFCTTCKNIFIPGKNCTVRTLTKLRKKHELHKRKKRHGKNKMKTINKGLVYTCKICGNRETIGMLTQRRNNRKT